MRKPLLLTLALITLPTLAFDQAQVMQPAALSNVQSVHVAPVALELPATTRRTCKISPSASIGFARMSSL